MNKTKNIHNKNKLFVASIAIVVALALFASPIVAMDDAFATKKNGKLKALTSLYSSITSLSSKCLVCFWWNNFSIMQQR